MEPTPPTASVPLCDSGHPYRHHVALITSRFRPAEHRLFHGMARLFGDRIELSGWYPFGQYRRCIPLAQIVHLESHADEKAPHLTIVLDTEEEVTLYLNDAFLWRATFENWIRYDVLPSAKLVDGLQQAAALAG